MGNVLFSQKRAQDVYKKGGLEILLVSYPVLSGETPLAKHCNALVEALRAYARSEPRELAEHALAAAREQKKLCTFSRHHLQIGLETVSKNDEILCALSLTLFRGTQVLYARKMELVWDGKGQFQKKRRSTQKNHHLRQRQVTPHVNIRKIKGRVKK